MKKSGDFIKNKKRSGSVSRVLFHRWQQSFIWKYITALLKQPTRKQGASHTLFILKNINLLSYLVLHRMGFTLPRIITDRAVRSYRTLSPLPIDKSTGGLLSAALAISSHCPAVSWHSALRCPDFPPNRN